MSLTRRDFLEAAAGMAAALPALAALPSGALRDPGRRRLVLLELEGGNDGLNTVIPYRDDRYYQARPTLAQPPERVHRLTDRIALHPALPGLRDLWERGQLAVIHGVGYPDPDRSHFQSRDIWHTAQRSLPAGSTGWIGRLADQKLRRFEEASVALAVDTAVPLALEGEVAVASSIPDRDSVHWQEGSREQSLRRRCVLSDVAELPSRDETLAFLRRVARETYRDVARLEELARERSAGAMEYPASTLGRRTRWLGELLAARFPAAVYFLRQPGYDTHALQAESHENLLRELDQAVSALFQDLDQTGQASDVCLVIYSEFGRRVRENGSRGTDHGAAAPCLVVSGGLAARELGEVPDLGELEDGDLRHQIDFRRIYATLLGPWLGVDPGLVLEGSWPVLPLFAGGPA